MEIPLHQIPELDPNQQVDFYNVVTTLIDTRTGAPSYVPKKLQEQIVIANISGAYRLYIYDTVGKTWRYATLT